MILECLLMCIMPYPSLIGATYYETANPFSEGFPFFWNDWLLFICIMVRLPFIFRSVMTMSEYTDPRA
jgi:hypothetical protein